MDPADIAHMRAALSLAARALGSAWPNPAVGCVIVRDGRVVGRGWTTEGGRPHAEAVALAMAGEGAAGATAYVTLEPCAHQGRAGPCADALVAAGIARVVAAIGDPDPRTAGQGFARLAAAGVAVAVGVEAEAARDVALGFLLRHAEGRPMVTLKLAASLDGRIATGSGESRWITSEAARARVQGLRASHDAIMVGIGTAMVDDPELACRMPGFRGRPRLRVVLDRHLRLPHGPRLVRDASTAPTLVLAAHGADRHRAAALRDAGVEVEEVEAGAEGVDARRALAALCARGVTRVLCEGGGKLAASLLRAGLVDRLVRFTGALAIGGDGVPAIAGMGLEHLSGAPRMVLLASEACGDGVVELWARAPKPSDGGS
ncbi:MAG: bifunctional diaminohydroxyphosphoribosylaminopyrimidine deaminase/5-amino-6-(5-phosphoribosylamino)uracil reductase RibD [Alphaproteobacteria bacterium]